MQTSLKRLGFQFFTSKDISAKFPRGGGGANPFSAIRLIVFINGQFFYDGRHIYDVITSLRRGFEIGDHL